MSRRFLTREQLRVILIVSVWHGACCWLHLPSLSILRTFRGVRRDMPQMGCCAPTTTLSACMPCEQKERKEADIRLPDCWDAHNHLQLSHQDQNIQRLVTEQEIIISLMGTQPADWACNQALAEKFPRQIRPNYGLHPWWAHEHPPPTPANVGSGWMAQLRTALENDPSACLGEIGLDGQWVPPGLHEVQYQQQLVAFRQQLQLAVELRRPVSLHCVKAYGDMFDILRSSADLPPAVYMHSWGGKLGMLESYLKMKKYGDRFYFGFSSFANLRENCRKTAAVIAAVPADRLLLESDLENPLDVVGALHAMLRVMADAKGYTHTHTRTPTQTNT